MPGRMAREGMTGHRDAGLDALRAIAALMVFVHHAQLPFVSDWISGLSAGVLVFFALSGYLLYRPFVVARTTGRDVDLAAYAVRRLARIMPAYLVASIGSQP